MRVPKGIEKRQVKSVEFALVPVSQYVELLEVKRLWDITRPGGVKLSRRSKSNCERTPEIAEFLAERMNKMTMAEACLECAEQFGEAVTPSLKSVHRYWSRLRVEQALQAATAR